MTYYYFIINELISFAKKEKRIFIIFIISLVLIVTGLEGLGSFDLYLIKDREELYDYRTRTYEFEFSKNANVFFSYLNSRINNIEYLELVSSVSENNILATGLYVPVDKYVYMFDGRYFNTEELNSISNIAIVSKSLYTGETLEKKEFIFNGEKYDVIGCNERNCNYTNQIILPIYTFTDKKIDIFSCKVIFKKILSFEKENNIIQNAKMVDSNVNITMPIKKENISKDMKLYRIITDFLILLIVLFNIISIYRFWLRNSKYRTGIYLMCGAKKRQLLIINNFFMFFLSSIAFLLGSGIYYSIINIIIKRISVLLKLPISIVGLYYLIYILLILFFTTISTIKMFRENRSYITGEML